MTLEEFQRLLDPEVQALIERYCSDKSVAFAMKFQSRKDLPVRAIAEQIACRQKAIKKLPVFATSNMLYTPLSLEQASGERTAAYKAIFLSGNRVIDLSGGLGIDAMFLAKRFAEVIYCERDQLLCAMMEHNLKMTGCGNVRVKNGESIELLPSYPDDYFDWIFIDPARRELFRRSVGLEAASPNVVACHDLLLKKAPKVCIKASPALELSNLKTCLPCLSEMIVVSVEGECREILLLLDREARELPATRRAVCLSTVSDAITEVLEDNDGERVLARSVKSYLYEPDPAIIKAKLTVILARQYHLEFVNETVDYLTAEKKVDRFPGRLFRVMACVPYKPKTFRAFLQQHGIFGASIQRRDFPLSPEDLRKKYRITESDQVFLFFTRNAAAQLVVVYCIRCFSEAEAAPAVQARSVDPGC
ncbi:MAG: hypothetical protein WCK32_09475 [Chlorobiaceae bacterium]